MSQFTLHLGDCLEVMRDLPDNSIDLIATDPPYYKVKGDAWDRQWDKPEQFLAWLDTALEQMARILKPNGSLYLFASPRMAARVEVLIGQRFNVLNRIRWVKEAGWHNKTEKEALRSYLSPWEEIIFAEQDSTLSFLRDARLRAGLSSNEAGALFPSASGGPTGAVRNWELGLNCPSREQYNSLSVLYPLPPYDAAIRPFSVTADVPYTDVWTFPTVQAYAGKHPCEKPLAMMRHIVEVSSRPGVTVLDCFMGSGTTGVAAQALGRDFIGVELDAKYFAQAQRRIEEAAMQMPLLEVP